MKSQYFYFTLPENAFMHAKKGIHFFKADEYIDIIISIFIIITIVIITIIVIVIIITVKKMVIRDRTCLNWYVFFFLFIDSIKLLNL
jgi:hypothetical protein